MSRQGSLAAILPADNIKEELFERWTLRGELIESSAYSYDLMCNVWQLDLTCNEFNSRGPGSLIACAVSIRCRRTVLTIFEDFVYHRQLATADGSSVAARPAGRAAISACLSGNTSCMSATC
jgi:hypothetical protein